MVAESGFSRLAELQESRHTNQIYCEDYNSLKNVYLLKSFTENSRSLSLMLTRDDEFISVDLKKVCNIFLTESSENLRSIGINSMCSFARGAKLTVTLQIVQADVELGAGSGEFAGTVHTVAFIVVLADLEGVTITLGCAFFFFYRKAAATKTTYLRQQIWIILQ